MLTPMFVAPVTSWGLRLLAALRVAVCVVVTAALSGCQQAASHEVSHELLYILDTDRSRPDSHAQLLVLDPQRKAIVKRYQGAEPIDFALSADGKRLYLARSQETPHGVNGQLDVIDTVSGAVMGTASTDLWVARVRIAIPRWLSRQTVIGCTCTSSRQGRGTPCLRTSRYSIPPSTDSFRIRSRCRSVVRPF